MNRWMVAALASMMVANAALAADPGREAKARFVKKCEKDAQAGR